MIENKSQDDTGSLPYKQKAAGSSPAPPTITPSKSVRRSPPGQSETLNPRRTDGDFGHQLDTTNVYASRLSEAELIEIERRFDRIEAESRFWLECPDTVVADLHLGSIQEIAHEVCDVLDRPGSFRKRVEDAKTIALRLYCYLLEARNLQPPRHSSVIAARAIQDARRLINQARQR